MSNPFVGFEIFTKRHNGNGNNGHPFGEDSHLDDDSILELPGDVDTGENYMEPPDFDDDDLDDIKDQATLPRNVRQAIESRDSEANFSEPDDYDYEPEVNQAQRTWKEETEQRDEALDKPRRLPQSEVYDPETDSYESENLSGDDFVKALGHAIDFLEKQQRNHRGRFKQKRMMSDTEAREFFDRDSAKVMSERQQKRDAELRRERSS
jgi:hypothetical protein